MNGIQYGIMACRQREAHIAVMLDVLRGQGLAPKVYWDDAKAGPWANARKFWMELEEDYGVLLQDDVIIPGCFRGNVEGVVRDGKLDTVCSGHWGNATRMRKAFDEGARWLYPTNVVWGQCVVLKRGFIRDVLEWECKAVKTDCPHDDARITLYLIDKVQTAKIAVPSLVGHDEVKSLMGHANLMFGRTRCSPVVADRVYDWTPTRENTVKGLSRGCEFGRTMRVPPKYVVTLAAEAVGIIPAGSKIAGERCVLGFVGGEFMGFVGTGPEDSVFVFPKFRRHDYEAGLTSRVQAMKGIA